MLGDYPDVGRVSDVVQVLQCSPGTVYQLIREGRLSAIRLRGKSFRVTRAALERFLAAEEEGTTTTA